MYTRSLFNSLSHSLPLSPTLSHSLPLSPTLSLSLSFKSDILYIFTHELNPKKHTGTGFATRGTGDNTHDKEADAKLVQFLDKHAHFIAGRWVVRSTLKLFIYYILFIHNKLLLVNIVSSMV